MTVPIRLKTFNHPLKIGGNFCDFERVALFSLDKQIEKKASVDCLENHDQLESTKFLSQLD